MFQMLLAKAVRGLDHALVRTSRSQAGVNFQGLMIESHRILVRPLRMLGA